LFVPRDRIEEEVQRAGRDLLGRVQPQRLFALSPEWWQERVLRWATADPAFRTRLLQFVDVLPALRTRAAVADHVRQYFKDERRRAARLGAAVAGEAVFRPVVSRVVREGVYAMADRFIGATDGAAAVPKLRELNREGVAWTIDLLGEATLSETEADAYRDRCLELLRSLAPLSRGDRVTRPNVSVKLSALSPRFEPAAPGRTADRVLERLAPILALARETGAFVNVDMEQHRYKDLVHHIFGKVAQAAGSRDWDGLGIVVQAYLRDAERDIARLAGLARQRGVPITVRLVKGAYWDEEMALAEQEDREPPVWTAKGATDANYERCTAALLAAYPHLRPAFGTHNPRSIAQAIARAEAAGVPREHVEFQMLYGMAEGLRKAVAEAGLLTRVYVPAGEVIPGMAYLVRRLLENTSNESWLLHRHEDVDAEEALAPPGPGEPARMPGEGSFRNLSPAQFHDPDVRLGFDAALAGACSRFGEHLPLLIGGRSVMAAGYDEVRGPADPHRVIASVARATPTNAEDAVVAARKALADWGSRPVHERADVLRAAANLLEERRFDLAATMVYESGKPWREADADVCEAADYLRYYAGCAEQLAATVGVASPHGEQNSYTYEPRGVAAVIAPWNFPLAILTGMTAAALAAGCTTVLKPSEQSPVIAARLAALLSEAGVPAGAVNYVPGPGETVGAALVEHPDVDVIAFTGSNAVGLHILRSAAEVRPGQRNVKKVVLEMGGKNAVIVDEDADLDQAVQGVVASAFGYAGQKCSACSRVIVVGSALAPFRDRLAAAVRSLVPGVAEDPFTYLPPVIDSSSRDRLLAAVAEGSAQGTLLAASEPFDGPGWHVAAHVFEGIPRDSRLASEELFGPVLLLFEAKTFEEALELAMDSPFALTGGVYSRQPAHLAAARARFRVGNLYVNRPTTGAIVGRQPFGGIAMSGAGDKAGGPDYILNFCWPRTVSENTMRHGFVADLTQARGLP
jgi:RHH-type proline utilization regulon transcriptional repressor/proline dehydrogenase/delta 1-pyrroline-5-carboxylate dehydrogenase